MTYDSQNIFARIIRGELPSKKIYEDDNVIAFEDIAPASPTHVLVAPKGEYVSFDDFAAKASPEQIAGFFKTVQKVAAKLDIDKSGYRIISNHGADAIQTVPHFHVHILGGRSLGKLLP